MLNIAMIGGTYEPAVLGEMSAKYSSAVDVPACVLQWKMIEGLCDQEQVRVHLINERRVPLFPAADVLVVPPADWMCELVSSARHFGFVNLPVIKRLSKAVGVLAEVRRWCRSTVGGEKALLVYSLHTPYLIASTIGAMASGAPQFLVIPDLPRYMDLRTHGVLRRAMKRIDAVLQSVLLRRVDGFILLSRHMAEIYGVPESQFMVLEGIADSRIDRVSAPETDRSANYILYTGALNERYGIGTLIEAFAACEDVGELWICGDGDARGLVEEACSTNDRIKYFGQLPRERVLEMQSQATLLVNPRDSRDEFTRYSFPSKTMEYMQSGIPLLMSRLGGIPEDYADYYWCVADDSVDAWAAALMAITALTEAERREFGERARDFISTRKTPRVQMGRVVHFISDRTSPAADEG